MRALFLRKERIKMAILREIEFVSYEGNIIIGEPVILRLKNGDRVRTSRVTDYEEIYGKSIRIWTKNTIYFKY